MIPLFEGPATTTANRWSTRQRWRSTHMFCGLDIAVQVSIAVCGSDWYIVSHLAVGRPQSAQILSSPGSTSLTENRPLAERISTTTIIMSTSPIILLPMLAAALFPAVQAKGRGGDGNGGDKFCFNDLYAYLPLLLSSILPIPRSDHCSLFFSAACGLNAPKINSQPV